MRKALLAAALALWLAPTAQAGGPRLLYSSDWSGSWQIYALDSSSGRPPAQLTFGQPLGCKPLIRYCGYFNATASPNGRWIAYTDSSYGCSGRGALFVARADGRGRRAVHEGRACSVGYVWSPDSKRLAYVVDDQTIVIVRIDGSTVRQISGREPAWSADGQSLAFLASFSEPTRTLAVWGGRRIRTLAHDVGAFAWSPTGKWIAFERTTSDPYSAEVGIVSADGKSERQLAADYALDLSWSGDGRLLAFSGRNGLEVVTVATGAIRQLGEEYRSYHSFPWSRRRHLLAFDGNGLELYDADTGSRRVLSPEHATQIAWAPDDRSVAFVVDTGLPQFYGGDVEIATISGRVRTALNASSDYGGHIGGLLWTVPSGKPRYRPALRRHPASVSALELEAPWPIGRLAADGRRVAYTTCGHLFVWTPATGAVTQAEPAASLTPNCTTVVDYNPFEIYDLALAGERLSLGARDGNMVQRWFLFQETLSATGRLHEVAPGGGFAGCTVAESGLGDLVGSGDLVVFSRWEERLPPAPCGVAVKQEIYRLDPGGCPCPVIASSPGPLLPSDVDAGRIVAVGTKATLILDRDGRQLLSLPVAALAAQLSAGQLVVLVQGQLRNYDASSGELVHAWQLPDVPSGGACGSPHPWACPQARLVLQDAARGLAAYVLDGQVHVLRLADGVDATIGAGTMARFMELGLVRADGAHLQLVPFASLPIRAFS